MDPAPWDTPAARLAHGASPHQPGPRSADSRQFQGRLVPLDLVDVDAATGKIGLRCTIAEFEKLDPAEMTVPLRDNDADPDSVRRSGEPLGERDD